METSLFLPEEVIHHIQSFMRRKDAARSAILSKSWYAASLTSPIIDLFDVDFSAAPSSFKAFAETKIQRYKDLSLKIQSFSLCSLDSCELISDELIVSAIQMGPTHLNLFLPFNHPSSSSLLPQLVLASHSLLKLVLHAFKFEGTYLINCSMLKSLRLHNVVMGDDLFKDLTCRCISLEELSLYGCSGFRLRRTNMYELPKLKLLFLRRVDIGDHMFFTNFDSRFPRLKDLTLNNCHGCTTRIQIASNSLQTVSLYFNTVTLPDRVDFDVPNIRNFTYSTYVLPSHLSINGASSREWELHMSITCYGIPETSWLMNLKKVLNKFRRSRISLFMDVHHGVLEPVPELDLEVVTNRLVLENLTIHASPNFCRFLLERAFEAFRPKCISHHEWPIISSTHEETKTKNVSDTLIQLLSASNGKEKFGQFGLKKTKLQFQLVWEY